MLLAWKNQSSAEITVFLPESIYETQCDNHCLDRQISSSLGWSGSKHRVMDTFLAQGKWNSANLVEPLHNFAWVQCCSRILPSVHPCLASVISVQLLSFHLSREICSGKTGRCISRSETVERDGIPSPGSKAGRPLGYTSHGWSRPILMNTQEAKKQGEKINPLSLSHHSTKGLFLNML